MGQKNDTFSGEIRSTQRSLREKKKEQ